MTRLSFLSAFFCNERCATWDTDGFLMEVTAMARAGNKYATKMLNKAGIDPYAECWRQIKDMLGHILDYGPLS